MTSSTVDILYVVLAVAAVWVTVFLCWALFEIATFVRRGNRIVDEATERLIRVERAVMGAKEKLENSAKYLGIMASGGKAIAAMFRKDEDEEKPAKRGKKRKSALFDEE
ncbi:hypothetical protein L0Y59_04855 [Candidatus Uhrbacteria bacterium]|nr:hypothetical protein [Candidatus Uhrbacteria bacterium]